MVTWKSSKKTNTGLLLRARDWVKSNNWETTVSKICLLVISEEYSGFPFNPNFMTGWIFLTIVLYVEANYCKLLYFLVSALVYNRTTC